MEAMLFGFCLVSSDLIAVLLLVQKRHRLSLIFEVLSLVLTGVTLFFWRNMLVQSGKSTELLGFHDYPGVPITVGVLALAALVCLVLGLAGTLKKGGKPE